MFRSFLLASLLVLSACQVQAATAEVNPCSNLAEATRDLNSQETENLLESCRPKVAKGIEELANPETANKWAEASKGFASAIGGAAKELGIAVNDFLDSPAGYILALILLLKFGGGTIIGGLLTVFTLYFWWFVNRRVMIKEVEYENTPIFWGALTMRRVKRYVTEKDEYTGAYAVISGLAAAGAILLIIWCNV